MYVDSQDAAACGLTDDRTPRQRDLEAGLAARLERRQKLFDRLATRYLSFDLWHALRSGYPSLFEGVGKTWRTTTDEARAMLVFLLDEVSGSRACRRTKGFARVDGLSYLTPLFLRPAPIVALGELAERINAAGLVFKVVDYQSPQEGKKGWARAVKIEWPTEIAALIADYRKQLARGQIVSPIRIDSPNGKPRQRLPRPALRELRQAIEQQIAACKNPVRRRRMEAFLDTPSLKGEMAKTGPIAAAQAVRDRDLDSAAAIARVAEVGRSWVSGRPDSRSTRVGGATSPGSIKTRYRRLLLPDGVELDLVAGALYNAAAIAPAPQARALLAGWAAAGQDPYEEVAREALAACGMDKATKICPEILPAARKRAKKIFAPLIGGARPDQVSMKPLEYRFNGTTFRVTGFAEAVLAHPVAAVPAALYGKDGRGGLARQLVVAGEAQLENGEILRLQLGGKPEARERAARRAIFLTLDRIEGAGIVAGLDFVRQCCRGRLRLLYDLHDGFAVRRLKSGPLTDPLIEETCRVVEDGMRAAGGFGRCRVSWDPGARGARPEETDEVVPF